jgi:predicted Zn-dependent peptidase
MLAAWLHPSQFARIVLKGYNSYWLRIPEENFLYRKTSFDNGLRLFTASMPHTRAVSVNFFVGTGSRYEEEVSSGVSHFIEHLCFRGTPKRPSPWDISAAIEGTGGIINAATDKELTMYWCKVAGPHFDLAMDVLMDMLLNSRFEAADIERERYVILEEIHMCNDSPAHRADTLIGEMLFPGHPLGWDIAGTRESVTSMGRETMLGYVGSQYRAGNTVLSVAGAVEHEMVEDRVGRELAGWPEGEAHIKYQAFREGEFRRVQVEKRDTEQVHMCLALPALPVSHPQRFALNLLNIILGEGMSSRLFTEIRDRLGLAYSIYSSVDYFHDSGAMIVSAGVDEAKLETAIEAILEQLSRLRDGIPEEDLNKARELFKGRLLLRLEDSRSVAGWMGGEEVLTGAVLTPDEVIGIVDGITTEELLKLACDLLLGEKLRLAAVGPVDNEEALERLLRI